jgi:hypothetical protein
LAFNPDQHHAFRNDIADGQVSGSLQVVQVSPLRAACLPPILTVALPFWMVALFAGGLGSSRPAASAMRRQVVRGRADDGGRLAGNLHAGDSPAGNLPGEDAAAV